MTTEKLLMTPEEAAKTLSVGRDRVFQLIASGELKSIKIGKSRRIPVNALRDYIELQLQQGGK